MRDLKRILWLHREVYMSTSDHGPSSNVISFASRTQVADSALSVSVRGPEPRQLEFRFNGERQVVFVVTDKLHGATFLRSIRDTHPVILFDLRIAPHLEFTAVSVSAAIVSLNKMGVRYIQRSVAFNELHTNILRFNPNQLALDLLSLAYGASPARGPLMVLVQHTNDAEAFLPYFAGVLQRIDGASWSISFVS
jgi:hypothetical protein